jgi:outer membrane protein assembly factor BamB
VLAVSRLASSLAEEELPAAFSGLNPASGKKIWTRPATASDIPSGQAPSLAVSGNEVIYLDPVRSNTQSARVAALDARTGSILWYAGLNIFHSWPNFCPGQSALVCVAGSTQLPKQTAEIRVNVRTGAQATPFVFSTLTVGRAVGDGLYDPGNRGPEYLLAIERGAQSWNEPLATIFTLPGASTSDGWTFDRVDRLGLFVGGPGWGPTLQSPAKTVYDLSRAMTAGVGIKDGAVVWRNVGAAYACGFLPCPGSPLDGTFTPDQAFTPSLGLRLRSRGTITDTNPYGTSKFLPSTPTSKLSPTADVTIEGFDLRTGKTRWAFGAGFAPSLITQSATPPLLTSTTLLVHDHAGRLESLDLATGAHHTVSAAVTGWCRYSIEYRQNLPYTTIEGTSTYTYGAQNGIAPCNGRMQRIPTPKSVPGFLGSLGARFGKLVIWADGALVARPMTGP